MQASGRTRMGRDLERDSGCGAEVGRPEGRRGWLVQEAEREGHTSGRGCVWSLRGTRGQAFHTR